MNEELLVAARAYFQDSAFQSLFSQQAALIKACVRDAPINLPVDSLNSFVELLSLASAGATRSPEHLLIPSIELACVCCAPVIKTRSNHELLLVDQFDQILTCLVELVDVVASAPITPATLAAIHGVFLCAVSFLDFSSATGTCKLSESEVQQRLTKFCTAQLSVALPELITLWLASTELAPNRLISESLCIIVETISSQASHLLIRDGSVHPLIESVLTPLCVTTLLENCDDAIQV